MWTKPFNYFKWPLTQDSNFMPHVKYMQNACSNTSNHHNSWNRDINQLYLFVREEKICKNSKSYLLRAAKGAEHRKQSPPYNRRSRAPVTETSTLTSSVLSRLNFPSSVIDKFDRNQVYPFPKSGLATT